MRLLVVSAAVAAVVFTLAGCGAAGTGKGVPSATSAAGGGGLLDLARCLRGQGLAHVGDPQVDPATGNTSLPGLDGYPKQQVQAALVKCGGENALSGLGNQHSQQAPPQDTLLAYARCMRSHGVNFPDPRPGVPMTMNPDDPATRAARDACRSILGAGAP